MMTELPNLVPAMPEIVLALAGLVLLLLGAFRTGNGIRLAGGLAIGAMAAAAACCVVLMRGRETTFGGLYVSDAFAVYAKVLVLAASAVSLAMAVKWMEQEGAARAEFPVLFLFAALGMCVMVSANDFLSLYMGLETMSLSLYLIAAFQKDALRSSEAGVKYFVLGALASGLYLFGASLVYGFTGTTNFDTLSQGFEGIERVNVGVVVGLVFMICALAFKVSAVPFHMWTPDVYEGAPTPVTAFFSLAPKAAGLALLLRLMVDPFGDLLAEWQQVVAAISVLSMLLGAVAAVAQSNIKRLMAYSAIGHVGSALVGLAVGNAEGAGSLLVYLTIYLVMNAGIFAVILSMRANGRLVEGIGDLAGLSRSQPAMATAMAILMFSMAGIPPFAGFFGKFMVFKAAVDGGLVALAVIGVLTSVVSAFYYLRIVKLMYFDEAGEQFEPMPGPMRWVLVGATLFVGVFFLFPLPQVVQAAEAAARSLFGG